MGACIYILMTKNIRIDDDVYDRIVAIQNQFKKPPTISEVLRFVLNSKVDLSKLEISKEN